MSWLEHYQPLVGVRLNMVAGAEGQFVDNSGSSRGISNDLDRRLLLRLRSMSDVVVTGGQTARVEKYRKPNNSALAIITRQNTDIPGAIPLNPPKSRGIAKWSVSQLSKQGFERVLLEVGPSLAKTFLDEDIVDEFCLTISEGSLDTAQLVQEQLGSKLSLASSELIDGTLFTRWRRGNAI